MKQQDNASAIIVSHSSHFGGAAKAAKRLLTALRKDQSNINNYKMWTPDAKHMDDSIITRHDAYSKVAAKLRPGVDAVLTSSMRRVSGAHQSTGLYGTLNADFINKSPYAVANLHWINNGCMSIRQVARITKPIVWTLHDMWLLCGTEHYNDTDDWMMGYRNRPYYDFNRLVFDYKKFYIASKENISLITPSNWLKQLCEKSEITRKFECKTIPNPIDTDFWQGIPKAAARAILGWPQDCFIASFGATGGIASKRKGLDILCDALSSIRLDTSASNLGPIALAIVGSAVTPKFLQDVGYPILNIGELSDELSLKIFYAASDVFILPSRQDNLPNMAIEAMSCGVPVIAFQSGGIDDIINDEDTGFLVSEINGFALGEKIKSVIQNDLKRISIAERARASVLQKFSEMVVRNQYLAEFERVSLVKP